ncbi:MAG: DUF2845 domain-containing protein [Deltaproteobacteria bacterium]|nr:DUF2845 domain-containing protein [Deltaproteobacteria bacterium]
MRATLVALFLVLRCVSPTSAWAVYCGNRLVSLVSGRETQTSVWYKCGEPDTTSRYVHYRAVQETDAFGGTHITGYVPVVTEVWVYNFGPRRFMEEFSFENGRLSAIAPLGYGY